MTSQADSRIYQLSTESELPSEVFTSRQMLQVTDQNNGAYNGTVTIEASSLANSGKWLSFREGYLTVPFVMAFKSSRDITATPPDSYSMCIKSGFHHLIDSCEIQFQNTTVQQSTPFSNFFNHFKILTTFSASSLVKYGSIIGVALDSPLAQRYSIGAGPTYGIASLDGHGVVANRLVTVQSFAAATANIVRNDGFFARASFHTDLTKTPTIAQFVNAGDLTVLQRMRWATEGAADAAIWFVEGVGVIRLKDISDFCAKLPLVKGGFVKLTLTTNTGTQTIAFTGNANPDLSTMGLTVAPVLQGRTFPMMVGSAAANEPLRGTNVGIAANNCTFTVGIGIRSVTVAGVTKTTSYNGGACRLYVPAYTLEPSYEAQYLEQFPTKEVFYHDVYNYVIPSVSAGGSIQALITNGILAPQYMLTVPILSAAANGTSGVAPHQSCFASEPGTTTQQAGIGRYNVQLSGNNVYQQDLQYDYDVFMAEVDSVNSLNGGVDDELSSGLISYTDWQTCYRYYVTDLSRGSPADALVPKSILLQGVNQSQRAMSYFVFVAYLRRVVLRPIDSSIVATS